jgi:hypothetical protein
MLILKPLFKKLIILQAYLEANYKRFHLYYLFTIISSVFELFASSNLVFKKGELSSH